MAGGYQILDSLSMVGIWLIIFVKSSLLPSITGVQAKAIPRGIGGLFGNKGGVCIRMMIHDTSVCFVSAHLTANREEVTKRNEDYHQIMRKRVFVKGSAEYMMQLQEETTVSMAQTKILGQVEEMKEQLIRCLQDIQNDRSGGTSGSETTGEPTPPDE
jgi:NADPH-dependent curcumin reductase CurA